MGADTLQAALDYAARGWPVLPVVAATKVPFTEHGLKDATPDPDQLRAWWHRWPNAGAAIATGQASGVVVLDVDIDLADGKNGLLSLEGLGIHTHPETPTSHTPRGGFHLLFEQPAFEVRNSTGRIGPDLDVRGTGGYCIMPPGPGRYWDPHLGPDTPLAPMPGWMVPTAPDRHRLAQRLNAYCERALDGAVKAITTAPHGQRHVTLNRECFTIGQLAGSGAIPPAMALDVLTWAGRQIPAFADHSPDKIVAAAFTDGLREPREVPHG